MANAGDPVGDLHLAVVNAPRAGTVRLGVVSLCLVQFVDVLGVTVMVTALPAMLADLHTSADAASLISTGYAMFFGGLLMLGARLGIVLATGASFSPAWRSSPWLLSWVRLPRRWWC
jgi:hypothetical protein